MDSLTRQRMLSCCRTQHDTVVLVSSRVILSNEVSPATIVTCVDSGKITAVHKTILPRRCFPTATYIDYKDLILMPGLVDTHVHLNEPGRTSSEGFYTGTQAAASGGLTTVIDMPLNSIPATTSLQNLRTKIQASQGKCWVDVGFLGGIIPGNTAELKPMIRAGIRGFKGFMIDSGVSQACQNVCQRFLHTNPASKQVPEFPQVHPRDIRSAMVEIASEPTMLMFHAEMLPAPDSQQSLSEKDSEPPYLYPIPARDQTYLYSEFLHSRPPSFETRAVRELVSLAREHRSVPIHIAHVSTSEVLPIIKSAQEEGINISAETCFHYLSISAEEVAIRDTRFKAEPPIREAANKTKLWSSLLKPKLQEKSVQYQNISKSKPFCSPLLQQPISMVVSDHSPCAPVDKLLPSYIPPHAEPPAYHDDVIKAANGDFFHAWGGISSLGFGLPVLWTELSTQTTSKCMDDSKLLQLSAWLSANPARLVGLEHQKGQLEVGFDGDVLVFDPDRYWTVEAADMKFKHKMSAYQGRTLKGRVLETWIRGHRVFQLDGENGGFGLQAPQGKLLLEPRQRHSEETSQECDCRAQASELCCSYQDCEHGSYGLGDKSSISRWLENTIEICCGTGGAISI